MLEVVGGCDWAKCTPSKSFVCDFNKYYAPYKNVCKKFLKIPKYPNMLKKIKFFGYKILNFHFMTKPSHLETKNGDVQRFLSK